jgi:hypothetical protein
MKLIKETYQSWGAEVVFITSNFQGNQEMMEGCKEAGIPAFVRFFISDSDDSVLILIHEGNIMGLLSYQALLAYHSNYFSSWGQWRILTNQRNYL